MTTQSTIDKLIEMRLTSMSDAFRTQMEDPRMKGIPFEDRFGMLVDIEYSNRKSNSLKRLIRNAGKVSSFCNDVIGDICGVISGSAAAVIAARVLILSKSKSEIFITLLLSAVVSGVTVGGKACGKSLAMNSSTAVVRTAAKVLCFFRTLPQRIRKKRAEK